MEFDLTGRTAFVTGATSGLGRHFAKILSASGAAVALAGRRSDRLEAVKREIESAGGRAAAINLDVTDAAEIAPALDKAEAALGPIDILVNNAWGGTRINRLENKDVQMFTDAFDLAFYSSLRLMQAVFPSMKEKGWGRIVNIGSLNGVNAHVYSAEYNVAKEALRTLTRTAAREWFRYGIVANVVCPFARVERHDLAWGDQADAIATDIGSRLPAGRMGDPDLDIAGVVSFLCSEDARFLTGNTLFVDGGGHISGVAWEPVPQEDAEGLSNESSIHRVGIGKND